MLWLKGSGPEKRDMDILSIGPRVITARADFGAGEAAFSSISRASVGPEAAGVPQRVAM